MTDIGQGIYLSRTDTQEWEPDDEVGGAAHMLFDESDVSKVGLWRADEGEPRGPSDPVVLPARETIVVLEGAVRVGVDGTTDLDLGPGDMASLPEGSSVVWDADPGCKVIWVYS
jgi:uncharacterized cupin superfamily protein